MRIKNGFDLLFRSTRMRLVVAIPVTMFLFTFGAGMLAALSMTNGLIQQEAHAMLPIVLRIVAIACAALVTGILLALGVTRPLKKMKQEGEDVLSLPSLPSQYSEIDDLSRVFNQMTFSLNRYIKDHQILENLPEGLIVVDQTGTIISANKTAEEIIGSDLNNRSYLDAFFFNSQASPLLDIVYRALKGDVSQYPHELKIKNKNGDIFRIWLSVSPLKDRKGILITIKNIRQLQAIRDQIRHAETMAGLGTLTSILSHEIKNPLGSIRGLLELIHEGFGPEDRRRGYVDRIIQEVDRLADLSEDLLDFMRLDKLNLEDDVNVNELLAQSLTSTQYKFQAKKITVQEKYQESIPLIKANSERLSQAFINLLINSFEATPEGGQISLTTESLPSGISICVHNTGSYIPPEKREIVFQPSYSTKLHGSGFGLFLVQRIILAHNGTIEIQSDPEEGTTFRIELPLGK